MLFKLIRQAILSPLPTVLGGLRFWRQHRVRIRRARVLCQCADGLRVRRGRDWKLRSDHVYRRAASGLRELVAVELVPELTPVEGNAETDCANVAHRTLWRAQEPIRALAAGLAVIASALAVATAIILLVGCAISPNLRGRLFPRDLAAGRPWFASSAAFGVPGTGLGPASDKDLFFHTAAVADPYVEIDLGAEHVIRSLLVENRADCCKERALPLDVRILKGGTWQLVAERRSPFSTWQYDIAPVRARKIRFQRPGTECFHLKRISVYGQ
jgi:hypothetical protein